MKLHLWLFFHSQISIHNPVPIYNPLSGHNSEEKTTLAPCCPMLPISQSLVATIIGPCQYSVNTNHNPWWHFCSIHYSHCEFHNPNWTAHNSWWQLLLFHLSCSCPWSQFLMATTLAVWVESVPLFDKRKRLCLLLMYGKNHNPNGLYHNSWIPFTILDGNYSCCLNRMRSTVLQTKEAGLVLPWSYTHSWQ